MFISESAPDTSENLRYRKKEMYSLGFVVFLIIAKILYEGVTINNKLVSNYNISGLKKGWLNTYIDLNDGQLKSFRESLGTLIFVAALFVLSSRLLKNTKKDLESRLWFLCVWGLGMAGYLHGSGVVYLLGMVTVNYFIASILRGKKALPFVVWVLNMGFLLVTEYYEGYQFKWWSDSLAFLDSVPKEMSWHRVSNLCMLKVVSFVMDWHWMTVNRPTPNKEKHMKSCLECTNTIDCLKLRQDSHANHYSLLSFAAYFFYCPLYLAGPTTSYNAWISQIQAPQQTYDTKRIINYTFRLLFGMLLLELSMHFLYFPTIANNKRNRHIWSSLTVWELIVASYLILKWIWLKFMVIWRFFRLWALLDGVESPENMGRCMSNNYCFEGFWRQWHRAFNQWLVRYIFIPLGGTKYKIFNIWIVFGFVALWHDLSMNLLAWGWGMCLFIMPEVLAKGFINQKRFAEFRKTLSYNWLCAGCGGFYIILMVIANLVGFSFGLSGLWVLIEELLSVEGLWMMFKIWTVLTVGTHLLFMLRREEERKGILLKGF